MISRFAYTVKNVKIAQTLRKYSAITFMLNRGLMKFKNLANETF